MSFLRQGWANAFALMMALAGSSPSAHAAVPPPPPPPNEAAGFEDVRKPPVPVSFSSADEGWMESRYPPAARDRVTPLAAEAEEARGELAEALGRPPLEDVEVRIAIHGAEEMASLAPSSMPPTAGATGMTYPKLKLI